MKTVLIVAASLGLSATAALADCAAHKVTAEARVDRTITTASVVTTEKQSRLPAEADPLLLEEREDPTKAE